MERKTREEAEIVRERGAVNRLMRCATWYADGALFSVAVWRFSLPALDFLRKFAHGIAMIAEQFEQALGVNLSQYE